MQTVPGPGIYINEPSACGRPAGEQSSDFCPPYSQNSCEEEGQQQQQQHYSTQSAHGSPGLARALGIRELNHILGEQKRAGGLKPRAARRRHGPAGPTPGYSKVTPGTLCTHRARCTCIFPDSRRTAMRSKSDLTRPGITNRHLIPAQPRTRTATSNLRTYKRPILASRGPRRPKIMIPEPRAVVF